MNHDHRKDDENRVAVHNKATDKQRTRVLLRLLKGSRAFLRKDGCMKVGGMIASSTLYDALITEGILAKKGDTIILSDIGVMQARRLEAKEHFSAIKQKIDMNGYRAQHQIIGKRAYIENGKAVLKSVNYAESPLGWLMMRKGKSGKSFISQEQYNAGERLRSDFERSGLSRSITLNYETLKLASQAKGYKSDVHGSDAQIDAKKRLLQALTAVGPVLNDSLLRICCYHYGLEKTEKGMGWPPRTGKVVLSIALDRLVKHYNNHIG